MSKTFEQKMEEDVMGEEESPILKEIPMYLSQALAEKLVLYQYPLEHTGLNTENSNVIQCSIKQNPHEIMLDLEKNTNSANYSIAKGEQFAINVDGTDTINKNPEEIMFPKNIMDRQMLIGRSLGEQNFAVGIFHENEIHLTPLKNVTLLRPSFKYIDKGDKRSKRELKDIEGDGSGEDEEELKQITVKFARQESEKTRKAREKSFGYVNQMNSKETWYTSNFYSKRSDRSEIEFGKFYCTKPNDRAKEIKMNTEEIVEGACSIDENESKSSTHGDSLSFLKSLPITEKVKRLLYQARLINFSKFIKYLGNTCDTQEYLKIVQQFAVLVQGCWVVQSDIVYYKEIVPGGISGTLMRAARDYVLYLFTKSRTITRQKILEIVKLPSTVVKEILEEFSMLLPSTREWEFMLPTDHDFIKSYPEVAQRQYIKWEMKHEKLVESFKNCDNYMGGTFPTKHRRKSYRDSSFSSDNESGAENRRNAYRISGPKIRRTKKLSTSTSERNTKGENT
ncbi:hypothetical protein RUM44_011014 [Polyplax serrata]|uniref:DNA-directed RNA polymerase III subunit RPC5 n=1 Tax=Polyplax serrata TaxID=468196 RepID=A0ABR1ANW0_POLSC